jgi:AmmeMemoRadiSam system protein B
MRNPVVAGTFYPSDRDELANFIDKAVKEVRLKHDIENAASYIAPHAGYAYSGRTAAHVYSAILGKKDVESVESIIIIGPNHTGEGKPISVSLQDWMTPIGISYNDTGLSNEICKTKGLEKDETAHKHEHSVEVQLPFIKQLFPDLKCCFISMRDQSISAANLVSNAVIKAIESTGRKAIMIASSDFNHYESRSIADRKDLPLFSRIEGMDIDGFYAERERQNESACGYGPMAVSMMFAKAVQNASKGMMLDRSDSGEQTGDTEGVVDYAAFAFS